MMSKAKKNLVTSYYGDQFEVGTWFRNIKELFRWQPCDTVLYSGKVGAWFCELEVDLKSR